MKSCLLRKAEVLNKLDEEILDEIDDEQEIAAEIEGSEDIQNKIREKVVQIEKVIKRETIKQEEGAMTSNTAVAKQKNIKLPKLEIDKFHEDPKKYRTFRDSFEVAIIKNESLSNVERFAYLRSYVGGEAKRILERLAVTNDNFTEAMKLFDSRYGNKQ